MTTDVPQFGVRASCLGDSREGMDHLPRPPIAIDRVLDDPGLIRRLVERHQPYWPVQRYFANSAEYAALSGKDTGGAMPVAPVFRGDWAYDKPLVEGIEPLLELPAFADAAERLFEARIVRPQIVYANLTWQLPFAQGVGHTDIPAFRGFDRKRYPITFLTIMGLSSLFEDVRVKIATAVAWFYAGRDGGFEYWPDGPDRPSRIHEGKIDNTAIVGDNDFMWHRVRPVGRVEDGMASLTLDSELVRRDSDWAIVDGDRTLGEFPFEQLRISVSWKAVVFEDEADARRYDEHTEDIGLDEVLRRFSRDLEARGVRHAISADPVRDPDFIRVLHANYVRAPEASLSPA